MSNRRGSFQRRLPAHQAKTQTIKKKKLPEHIVTFTQLDDIRTAWQLYETEENKN